MCYNFYFLRDIEIKKPNSIFLALNQLKLYLTELRIKKIYGLFKLIIF